MKYKTPGEIVDSMTRDQTLDLIRLFSAPAQEREVIMAAMPTDTLSLVRDLLAAELRHRHVAV